MLRQQKQMRGQIQEGPWRGEKNLRNSIKQARKKKTEGIEHQIWAKESCIQRNNEEKEFLIFGSVLVCTRPLTKEADVERGTLKKGGAGQQKKENEDVSNKPTGEGPLKLRALERRPLLTLLQDDHGNIREQGKEKRWFRKWFE